VVPVALPQSKTDEEKKAAQPAAKSYKQKIESPETYQIESSTLDSSDVEDASKQKFKF
jgi:hypothetical protein